MIICERSISNDKKPFVAGCAGTVVADDGNLVAITFAHGLVLFVFAYGYGHISGAILNLAVTTGLWFNKEIDSRTALGYIVVQLLDGIAAALTLAAILAEITNLGQTTLAPETNIWQGLLVETLLTIFFVNTIFNTDVGGKVGLAACAAIGLTLTFATFFGGNLTGASLNPARTLGPVVVSGTYSDIWIYFVGPVLSGIVAALLYRYLRTPAES